MAHFAVIEDGKVINTILADSKAIAEEITGKTCVEYDESDPVLIGSKYDGVSFSLTLTTPEPE